jgi:hypothetical protein
VKHVVQAIKALGCNIKQRQVTITKQKTNCKEVIFPAVASLSWIKHFTGRQTNGQTNGHKADL